jgi:hypothetical protein
VAGRQYDCSAYAIKIAKTFASIVLPVIKKWLNGQVKSPRSSATYRPPPEHTTSNTTHHQWSSDGSADRRHSWR